MQQTSLTVVLTCDPETLWAILADMVKNPSRYEDQVTLKRRTAQEAGVTTRLIERRGQIFEEKVEFHTDALMVEISIENPAFTLIHQIVPAGDQTILNLAATWELDPEEGTNESVDQRLEALGERVKKASELLSN